MRKIVYVYKANPSLGEMLLANDSSAFTRPYFASAEARLKKTTALRLSHACVYTPSEGCEDPVMAFKREAFRLSEWLLLALIVDENDELASVLMLERGHQEHCLVYSFSDEAVTVCSILGVEVLEEEGERMSSKEFLSTLSLPLETPSFHPAAKGKPVNLGYREETDDDLLGDEDDFAPIAIVRPDFVPVSKKGSVMNLGSSSLLYQEDEEGDDEAPNIVVEKASFAPSNSKKPRNLGSIYQTKKTANPISVPREEDDEEVHIDISSAKENFAPRKNKKPLNLGSTFDRPAKKTKTQDESERPGPMAMPVFEKAFEPGMGGKPRNLSSYPKRRKNIPQSPQAEGAYTDDDAIASSFQKPDFTPNVQLKAEPRQANFDQPEQPNQKRYASQEQIRREAEAEKKLQPEEPICLFRASADIYESRTIINDPSLHFVHAVFEGRWRRILSTPEGLLLSPRAFYLGADSSDPVLRDFKPEEWDILAANVDADNEPYAYLLSKKGDRDCCIAVLRKEKALALLCLSRKGIGTENPHHEYSELVSICFPKGE